MNQFKGKAIYQPSGKAAEYSRWACNFYVGCSNGCEYCYCKKGILKNVMGQDKPQLKACFKDRNDALKIFYKELFQNKSELQKHGLFFSFTTDPGLPGTIDLTFEAAVICNLNNIPVKILTKVALPIIGYAKIYTEYFQDKSLIALGFTLTGHD